MTAIILINFIHDYMRLQAEWCYVLYADKSTVQVAIDPVFALQESKEFDGVEFDWRHRHGRRAQT